jgi:hypothetical protein
MAGRNIVVQDLEISNLEEYMKACSKMFSQQNKEVLWFRGQDHTWDLKPGIYRDVKTEKQLKSRVSEEQVMINDFYVQAPLKLGRSPRDGWEWLAIMQHRRLPTRLLDWSESVLQALFFALHKWDTAQKRQPVVYVLDPSELNQRVIDSESIVITDNERLANWLPNTLRFFHPSLNLMSNDKGVIGGGNKPLAIYVQHVDSRIGSQKGAFTLHGTDFEALEKNYTEIIGRIYIDATGGNIQRAKRRSQLLYELDFCGVNEHTTYGDLDSLSEYLSRIHLTRNK